MDSTALLLLAIGLLLGFIIAHFYKKSTQALTNEDAEKLEKEREEALQTISRMEERNQNLSSQLQQAEQEQKQAQRHANEAEKKLAELNANYRNLQERLAEQKEEMKQLQERFKDEFENLANKILEEKSQKFTEQNREKLDQLLKPLGEKMDAFKKKVEETYEKEMREQTSLKEQIKQMAELNKQMTKEANDLTKALKGESKTQGSWGEVILQRILEKSGLTKGREYEIEQHHTLDDGSRLRPDVVVHLPDEKRLIIDSKVSLTDYEQYSSAAEEDERRHYLKKHINSLRGHVKNLSSKNYQQLYNGNSPDFVLLFVPIESAFGAALQYDTSLYYEAFDKNIVIVSPSTLLATLATIDSVWKQEYQSRNAQEIADRGGALYDKFVLFVESMEDIGQRIRQTQDSYEEAMNRLSEGRGNVVRQVEMLRELKVKNTKSLPKDLEKRSRLQNGQEN